MWPQGRDQIKMGACAGGQT
jgi:hypothetical protein